MNKEQKIFLGCFTTFLIISSLVLLSAFFIKRTTKEAFGPIKTTIDIKLSDSTQVICNQTYNADFADVFYDVEFILMEINNHEINLGNATFSTENWQPYFNILYLDDWIILPVSEPNSLAKILSYNRFTNIKKDTVFSPQELIHDPLWKSIHNENPAWVYPGFSTIDSIDNNKFYINYYYRIGLYEPFEFYNQVFVYEMDPITGKFNTKSILERVKN